MATGRENRRREGQALDRLTVLVVVAGLLLVAGLVVRHLVKESFIIKVKLQHADGLNTGAEVQYAGVKVGTVKAIRFLGVPDNPKSREIFEIVMEIDPQINGRPAGETIRKDSTAVLIATGALGDRLIDIRPGNPSAPPTLNGEYIAGGIETSVATLLDNSERIRKNSYRVNLLIAENADWVKRGRGNVGLFNSGQLNRNVDALNKEIDALQREVERGKGTVGRFNSDKKLKESLNRLEKLTERLRKDFEGGRGSAGKFFKDEQFKQRVDALQARFNQIMSRFEQISARAQKGENSIARLQDERFQKQVRELEGRVNKISRMISEKQGTAGLFLHDSRLTENMGEISTELVKLLYDFQQKPTRYVKFTIF